MASSIISSRVQVIDTLKLRYEVGGSSPPFARQAIAGVTHSFSFSLYDGYNNLTPDQVEVTDIYYRPQDQQWPIPYLEDGHTPIISTCCQRVEGLVIEGGTLTRLDYTFVLPDGGTSEIDWIDDMTFIVQITPAGNGSDKEIWVLPQEDNRLSLVISDKKGEDDSCLLS